MDNFVVMNLIYSFIMTSDLHVMLVF